MLSMIIIALVVGAYVSFGAGIGCYMHQTEKEKNPIRRAPGLMVYITGIVLGPWVFIACLGAAACEWMDVFGVDRDTSGTVSRLDDDDPPA